MPDDESREMFRVPPLVEEMMKRGWLGEKTGSGFYKRVKGAGGESEILTLDWQKMEYRAAAKGEIRLDRGGKGNRRYARAPAIAGRRRLLEGKAATRPIVSLVVPERDVPVRRAPRCRKSRIPSWTWTTPCDGDSAGSWGRLKCGMRSASSGWRKRSSATESRCRRS